MQLELYPAPYGESKVAGRHEGDNPDQERRLLVTMHTGIRDEFKKILPASLYPHVTVNFCPEVILTQGIPDVCQWELLNGLM